MDFTNLTILEVLDLYKTRKASPKEYLESLLNAVKLSRTNSLVFVNTNIIKETKDDEKTNAVLANIPLAVKDNISIKGWPLTCASAILKNYISLYNATAITLLKEAGALFLAKTNMDEFAMGSSSEYSVYGAVKNPIDLTRTAGGSSGGSAAAVAEGLVPAALGSDTGGSIRQPAALTGTVGLKPTYGTVSRYGLVAFASSLDQIGPITRSVLDAALILSIIAKYDSNDSTSINANLPAPNNIVSEIKSLKDKKFRIGIPKEYIQYPELQQEIAESLENISKLLAKNGHEIVEVSLKMAAKYSIPVYYIVATAEASSNLARYDGIRYGLREEAHTLDQTYFRTRTKGFGIEVKRRIVMGTYVLSSGYYDQYYMKALKVRRLIKNEFDEVFKNVDFILTPTTPTTAFKLGEKLNDPVKMYLSDLYTVPVNLAGLPAISVPTAKDKNNLPIGLQIIAPPLKDLFMLALAYQIEQLLS